LFNISRIQSNLLLHTAELRKFLLEEAEVAKGLNALKRGLENLLGKKPSLGFIRNTYSPFKKRQKN